MAHGRQLVHLKERMRDSRHRLSMSLPALALQPLTSRACPQDESQLHTINLQASRMPINQPSMGSEAGPAHPARRVEVPAVAHVHDHRLAALTAEG